MQLLSLHVDTVQALQRLHIPFDDLTPEGLWGSPYHLVGVTAEQRDVLKAWNISIDEITPSALKGALAASAREHATANRAAQTPRVAARPVGTPRENAAAADQARPVAASREPVSAPRPAAPESNADSSATPTLTLSTGGRAAMANQGSEGSQTAAPSSAAAEAPARSKGERGATAERSAARAADIETPIVSAAIADAEDALRDGAKLRTNVRGKYVEASVQHGKILLDGKTFDSTEQASKGISPDGRDLAFWEYYDERARKWRILDRA